MRRYVKDIARERIERLIALADEIYEVNKPLSKRYIELALRISMRSRVRIPRHLKDRICKKCLSILKPGVNCTVRIRPRREKHIVIKCLECGHVIRIPIKRRLRAKTRATRRGSGTS